MAYTTRFARVLRGERLKAERSRLKRAVNELETNKRMFASDSLVN